MKDSEIIGVKFGKRTVMLNHREPNTRGDLITKCLCLSDCGEPKAIRKHNLTSGHTKSDGYDKIAAGRTKLKHGHSLLTNKVSPTYRTWKSMKWRCGRQVGYLNTSICDRWKEFSNFLEDMGERPDGTSIDRIDSNGNYEPNNCRWATDTEQANNRRPRGIVTK